MYKITADVKKVYNRTGIDIKKQTISGNLFRDCKLKTFLIEDKHGLNYIVADSLDRGDIEYRAKNVEKMHFTNTYLTYIGADGKRKQEESVGYMGAFERAIPVGSDILVGGEVAVDAYNELSKKYNITDNFDLKWVWFAKAFKRKNDENPSLTLGGFISKRWGKDEKVIRLLCSIIVAFFYIIYAASQFVGAGKTINTLFGYDVIIAMAVAMVVVVIYSSLGGLKSVVWTDVFQGIIMCFALIVLPILAFINVGSTGTSVFAEVAQAGPDYASLFGGMTVGAGMLMVFNETSWIWGNFGMPAVTQKIMALKSEKDIKIGRITGLIWGAVWYLGIFGIGLAGIAMYGAGQLEDSETLFPTMVSDLLPPALAAITLCGVIAAIMSTTADQLLAVSSSVSVDIIQKNIRKGVPVKKPVLLSRIVLICAGIFALLVAVQFQGLVMTMVSFAWCGMGSSLGPSVLLTLLDKKTSGKGIIATLISGVVLTFAWSYLPLTFIHMRLGTFFFALIIGIIVSRVAPNKEAVNS